MDAGLGLTATAWSQGGPVLGPAITTGLDYSDLQAPHGRLESRQPKWGFEAYPSLGGLVRPISLPATMLMLM